MESNNRSLSSADESESRSSSKITNITVQSQEHSNMEVETNDLSFENLIAIDVIFDYLERLISYKDLKTLRLVSKKCEEVVLQHKFLRKTKLIVRDRTIDSKVLENVRFKPKSVKIEQFIGVSLEELDTKLLPEHDMRKVNEIPGFRVAKNGIPIWSIDEMKPVLKLCEDVQIMEIQGPPYTNMSEKLQRLFPPVKDLLAAPKSLKSLKLKREACFHDLKKDISDAKGRQMEELTIAVDELILEGPCGSILRCIHGFERLTDIKVIHVREDNDKYSCMRRIMEIITTHGSTLQSIELESFGENRCIFSMLKMYKCIFPKLEKFKTSFALVETERVIAFVSWYFDQLTELTLELNGEWKEKFPEQMHHFLLESHSKKLLALRLHHPLARQYDSIGQDWFKEHTAWNFRHFSSLQELVFDIGHVGGKGIRLEDLPPSLKRVFIRPCYQIIDNLVPVLRNIHKVFHILPELDCLELRGYRAGGHRDIVLSNLQRMKKKPEVALKLRTE